MVKYEVHPYIDFSIPSSPVRDIDISVGTCKITEYDGRGKGYQLYHSRTGYGHYPNMDE